MMHAMTRRRFFKTGAAGLLAQATLSSPAFLSSAKAHKPNLLFIWTDEQRADTMAAYGNTKIHSPNLNKLASKSVVFEKAYVTQPVCTPSRSSVITGLWPHTTGCTRNNIPLPKDTPCLPELLNDPEYRTAYMGKWHLGDEIFGQHGFEEMVSIEDSYNRYYSKDRDRSERSSYHHFLVEKGYPPGDGNMFSRTFAASLPIGHCKPKFLENRACEFLRRHRDEPFILYINFLEPHMPFSGPLNEEHDLDEVYLPATFNDPLEENKPLRYRILREFCRAEYGKDEKAIRELIRRYWGLVTQVDRSVGVILKTLDDLGLADNTIVVYTSDHGDMMGAHNLVTKCVMYEEAARVPWLMRIGWMVKRQHMIKNPVSHIDMVPTLLELMGVTCHAQLPGQSLVPLIQGGKVAEDHVYIEWNPGPETTSVPFYEKLATREESQRVARERTRAVIAPDGWKLCLSDVDKSQLFNLRKDPGETTNLFYSGRHDEIIKRLTKKIHQWQIKVNDKTR